MWMWTLLLLLQYNDSIHKVQGDEISDGDCGRIDTKSIFNVLQFRVTGGNDILINQSPWSAILELSKESNEDEIEVFCGGSLISSKLITTAAHCLWGNRHVGRECPEQYRNMKTADECHSQAGECPVGCRRLRPQDINVYLGVTSIRQQDRRPLSLEAIHIHELWDKSKLSIIIENLKAGNDIAILQMSEAISFTPKIQPICLPDKIFGNLDLINRRTTIDGFGSVNRGLTRKNAQRLQRGIISILPKDTCNTVYNFSLTSDLLCAGSKGVDSCRGDSGSGLTTELNGSTDVNVLLGITSFGSIFCGKYNWPAVYTNVRTHMDWIQARMSATTETWGPWSPCSATCGTGVRRRRSLNCGDLDRHLTDLSNVDDPVFNDFDISEPCFYTEICFNQPCNQVRTVIEPRNNIGHILLVGGYVGAAKQSNQVFLQDCHYAAFEDVKIPSFPVNISLSTGGVLEDTVYICGGFNGKYESQSHCFTFTFQPGEKWKEGPRLTTPRANADMISTKTGLWITGGRNGLINFLDSTEFFNKSTGAWVRGPSLTRKLGLHIALADGSLDRERMIIIGGAWYDDRSQDFMKTNAVESYDLSTGDSTTMPLLQTPRASHSCLLFHGKDLPFYIIVAGGKTSRRERLSSVEYFEDGASRWVYLEPLPLYICGAKFVFQNRLPLLIGGIVSERGTVSEKSNPDDINKFSDSVYAYDERDDEWNLVGKVHETVAFHTAVALPDQLCQQGNKFEFVDCDADVFKTYVDYDADRGGC